MRDYPRSDNFLCVDRAGPSTQLVRFVWRQRRGTGINEESGTPYTQDTASSILDIIFLV